MWDLLWVTLIAIGVLLYGLLRARERFVIKVGNPFKEEDLLSFDRHAKGTRLIGFYPDTCPAHKPDLEDGLCYKPCADGYYGVGPVCWAETKNIGVGMFAALNSCADSGHPPWDGWVDMGLFCFKPPSVDTGSDAWKVWDWKWEGGDSAFKTPKCPPGGAELARFKKLEAIVREGTEGTQRKNLGTRVSKDPNVYWDAVEGMCYKPCPKDKPNHVPGAPYLCYKNSIGRGLSYGRGEGAIPPPFILGSG